MSTELRTTASSAAAAAASRQWHQIGLVGPWAPGEGQMMITKKVPLLVCDMFRSQKTLLMVDTSKAQMMITKKVPLLVCDMFHSQKNIADG